MRVAAACCAECAELRDEVANADTTFTEFVHEMASKSTGLLRAAVWRWGLHRVKKESPSSVQMYESLFMRLNTESTASSNNVNVR